MSARMIEQVPVWYSKPERAAAKALRVAKRIAEPCFVIKDHANGMYGVGVGEEEPQWVKDMDGMELWIKINPPIH